MPSGTTTSRAMPTSSRRTSATCARRSTGLSHLWSTPSDASVTACESRVRETPGPSSMRIRRRLIAIMIVLVALGLVAVDVVTYSSLHSYLYGRTDDQLGVAQDQ